jgi:hypothetical protein
VPVLTRLSLYFACGQYVLLKGAFIAFKVDKFAINGVVDSKGEHFIALTAQLIAQS